MSIASLPVHPTARPDWKLAEIPVLAEPGARWADGSVFRLDKKTLGYGMGWAINERPGHKSVGHSGGNSTAYARFLDDGVTVILLHNGNGNPDALLEGVAQRVIPALAEAGTP
jgi:hypothetical protein